MNNDEDKEVDEAMLTLMIMELKIKDSFKRLICDESHEIKFIKTRSHRALGELSFDIITASAMLNKPINLCGIKDIYGSITHKPGHQPERIGFLQNFSGRTPSRARRCYIAFEGSRGGKAKKEA